MSITWLHTGVCSCDCGVDETQLVKNDTNSTGTVCGAGTPTHFRRRNSFSRFWLVPDSADRFRSAGGIVVLSMVHTALIFSASQSLALVDVTPSTEGLQIKHVPGWTPPAGSRACHTSERRAGSQRGALWVPDCVCLVAPRSDPHVEHVGDYRFTPQVGATRWIASCRRGRSGRVI